MQLYNLKKDIGEKKNLAAQRPEIIKEMYTLLKTSRTESEIFKFKTPKL